MPFDATPTPVITETPDLATLAYVLRHRELWPEGFVWDYEDRSCCAMGLAYDLWDAISEPDEEEIAATLHIPLAVSQAIFINLDETLGFSPWRCGGHVTPEHVADAIDQYLLGATLPPAP